MAMRQLHIGRTLHPLKLLPAKPWAAENMHWSYLSSKFESHYFDFLDNLNLVFLENLNLIFWSLCAGELKCKLLIRTVVSPHVSLLFLLSIVPPLYHQLPNCKLSCKKSKVGNENHMMSGVWTVDTDQ